MRPARKARGGRIPGIFKRRATPRPGMQRRPNVTGLRGRDTRALDEERTFASLLEASFERFVLDQLADARAGHVAQRCSAASACSMRRRSSSASSPATSST